MNTSVVTISSRWPRFHLTFVNEYRTVSADTVGGIQALLSREQKLSSFYASFPILCAVDVSYETLPVNPALCFIP